jgi:spore coat polysaccharide biosynthesis predicted glycosyltransferase SpsG
MMRIGFRTRGGDDYGWGHIARTKVLAEALRASAPDVDLVAVVDGPDWVWHSLAESMAVRVPAAAENADARAEFGRVDVVIVDLLDIDERLMVRLREQARKVVAFSDMGEEIPLADLVIQPQVLDRRVDDPRVLRGPDYFILDRAYRAAPRRVRQAAEAQRLLVCLGGEAHGDAPEHIAEVLSLVAADWQEILWVVGRGLDPARLATLAARVANVRLVEFVDDMPNRLESADCALISGGFVKWEAACCGTPAIVIALVDHQDVLGRQFEKTGAAHYVGRLDRVAPATIAASLAALQRDAVVRRRMSEAGQRLIDADGATRVAAAVLALAA